MERLHQIYEEDLATLEKTLPQLADALVPTMTNRQRVQLRQVQTILSRVRWNYGPPEETAIINPDDDTQAPRAT